MAISFPDSSAPFPPRPTGMTQEEYDSFIARAKAKWPNNHTIAVRTASDAIDAWTRAYEAKEQKNSTTPNYRYPGKEPVVPTAGSSSTPPTNPTASSSSTAGSSSTPPTPQPYRSDGGPVPPQPGAPKPQSSAVPTGSNATPPNPTASSQPPPDGTKYFPNQSTWQYKGLERPTTTYPDDVRKKVSKELIADAKKRNAIQEYDVIQQNFPNDMPAVAGNAENFDPNDWAYIPNNIVDMVFNGIDAPSFHPGPGTVYKNGGAYVKFTDLPQGTEWDANGYVISWPADTSLGYPVATTIDKSIALTVDQYHKAEEVLKWNIDTRDKIWQYGLDLDGTVPGTENQGKSDRGTSKKDIPDPVPGDYIFDSPWSDHGGPDPIQGYDVEIWVQRQDLQSGNNVNYFESFQDRGKNINDTSQFMGGAILLGQFTGASVMLRMSTEPYMEYDSRTPIYMDGEVQIAWRLEKGLVDMTVLRETFGMSVFGRRVHFNVTPKINIVINVNSLTFMPGNVSPGVDIMGEHWVPPQNDKPFYRRDLNNEVVLGSYYTSTDLKSEANIKMKRHANGRIVLKNCKVDAFNLDVQSGKHVVMTNWSGVADEMVSLVGDPPEATGSPAGAWSTFPAEAADTSIPRKEIIQQQFIKNIAMGTSQVVKGAVGGLLAPATNLIPPQLKSFFGA